MAGTIHVNSIGQAHLNSLVEAGKVSDGPWTPPKGGDPNQYLAVDSSVAATDEAHYKYPFTNGGSVNKKALASIESYATQNSQPDIASAAHEALAKISDNMSEANTTGSLNGVEIFRAGKWRGSRDVEITSSDLDTIVSNFHTINQISGYGVPVKLGHNHRVGEPAYGWMSDLSRVNDTLVADFADMDPAIVDAIGHKRYNSVSIELYPNVTYGGKSYNNVLGGVALLGAEWPAVKGLKPLSASKFAEADEKLELTQMADNAAKFTQGEADALVLAAETRVRAEGAANLAASEAKLKIATEGRVIAETALKTFHDDADKAKIDAIIALAEKAGTIVPANKDRVTKFAQSVMKSTDAKDRAELMATFGEIVAGLKPKVEFKERGNSKSSDTLAADGSKASDEIAAKANALLAADTTGKLDFSHAVSTVLAQNPDLKTAYAQE